ncbi:GNAT family N-acetyltransferase [Actinokineospora spheciospongiae]|uniref:GNAT family N-acetyltransferase n=1 Tax=Actinokineospora spheciospongiae TaxID=909613 RepID=UPI000D70969C|nr:GNAT family N-acetyltransferase [Actinokineospora spheciospongiae]PWW64664.1 RimJ/RimL family protein N-acetyltransferase [Actinokineospora spheciospongiae]
MRPLRDESELTTLCSHRPDAEAWRRMITHGLGTGLNRLEWCWLAEEAGEVTAALAWWAPIGATHPHMLDLLATPDPTAAVELITHSRRALDIPTAECNVVTPDDTTPDPVIPDILRAAGFTPAVDRVRVEWTPTSPLATRSGEQPQKLSPIHPAGPSPVSKRRTRPRTPLELRQARHVDEDTLMTLFAQVGDGTLDHHSSRARATRGRTAEAADRLHKCFAYPGDPTWFTIGFTPDGHPAGYVVPALIDGDHPVLAEIGVAQPFRGQGHVDHLLTTGTRALTTAGATRVHSDTDQANHPMRAAFARAGYREFATRRDYAWTRPH